MMCRMCIPISISTRSCWMKSLGKANEHVEQMEAVLADGFSV